MTMLKGKAEPETGHSSVGVVPPPPPKEPARVRDVWTLGRDVQVDVRA